MANKEIERLRRAQAKAVMPLIGPLLDAFEGIPNDLRDDEELTDLFNCLERINSAMEDSGDDHDA